MSPRLTPQRRWAIVNRAGLVGVPYPPINGKPTRDYVRLLLQTGEVAARVEVRDARPCVWRWNEGSLCWDAGCTKRPYQIRSATSYRPENSPAPTCCPECGAKVKVAK